MNGNIEEEIYIELLDGVWKKEEYVGKLIKATYGTPGSLRWQQVVRENMKAFGFNACGTVACLHHHRDRDVFVVAHVDDVFC